MIAEDAHPMFTLFPNQILFPLRPAVLYIGIPKKNRLDGSKDLLHLNFRKAARKNVAGGDGAEP